MKVILSWLRDWDALLRNVYNPGIKRHEPLRVLGCANCGRASEDIRENEHAWDGWTVAPVKICPNCAENGKAKLPNGVTYPEPLRTTRRQDYLKRLKQIKCKTGGKS